VWALCSAVSFHNVENGILAESESVADFSIRLSFADELQHLGCESISFDSLTGSAAKDDDAFLCGGAQKMIYHSITPIFHVGVNDKPGKSANPRKLPDPVPTLAIVPSVPIAADGFQVPYYAERIIDFQKLFERIVAISGGDAFIFLDDL
jgi:hypothetical protein